MMTCLFHYSMDVGLIIQYLGSNYTGAYRNVNDTAAILASLDIDPSLVQLSYTHVMYVGCPNHLVAKTTRDNAM